MRKLKHLGFKAESKINLKTCHRHFKDSIIWLYANENEQQRLVDCGCSHICIMVPFCFFSSSESRQDSTLIARTMTSLATHAVCWQSGRQAPTSFCYRLPLVTSSLKSAVLFTRNCYQRRGQKKEKKKDHMPWAADLCFLYLHVSQNTAIYRNTEKRPQQTSSRTEGFVL